MSLNGDLHTRLVDRSEAAWYLGTTERHVRELWAQRKLGGVKVGRVVRFRVQDLDEYVDRNRVEALSQ